VQERGTGPALTPAGEPDDVGLAPLPRRRVGVVAAAAAAVVAADQLTKWWAVEALDDRSIDLLLSLRLRLTYNTGTAFSLGAGRGGLLALVAIAAVVAMVWMSRRVSSAVAAVSLGLVLGGAVGNLADRAFRAGDGLFGGAVVDFVDLQWWPVFNLADAAIVCGAAMLLLSTRGDGDP
jgi:signal peptidase II